MGLRSLIGVLVVGLATVFVGCDSDDAQKIQPETRGKRGERCQARNDCESGLACLNNTCAKNEFDIDVSVRQCDRIECSTDTDCCGSKPTSAPAKCKQRDAVCSPQISGCLPTGGVCTSDASCTGGGQCPAGTCPLTGDACTANADCADRCDELTGTCTVSGALCTAATEATVCTYYNTTLNCSTRTCSCANPEYNPADPICSDEECLDICLLRCQDERCLQDNSCDSAADCSAAAPLCEDGRCVQCVEDDTCDVDANETCESGFCHKPCEKNEECGLFEACQDGDCVYVGCNDDKECILAAARGLDGVGGTNGTGISSGGDDPRLFKCLPSETDETINTCKIPCENDGSCGKFQVCDGGYCKFIGCESDEQCRAYLGIANQQVTEAKPFVPTAVCREEP